MKKKGFPIIRNCPKPQMIQSQLLRISGILFLLILTLAFCSKKKEEEPYLRKSLEAGKFAGSYLITPSFRKEEIIIGPGTEIRYQIPGEAVKQGKILLDDKVLRIFIGEERNPSGTFLIHAYSDHGWKGFWKGEIRELKRNTP